MPNNFGGPQDHPAYDPRRKLDPETEYLLGGTLYTKVSSKMVEAQEITGHVTRYLLDSPDLSERVRRHFEKKRKAKGSK